MRLMFCPYCGNRSRSGGIGAVHCGPHRDRTGYVTPAVRMRETGHRVWQRHEFGHLFEVFLLDKPGSKGRSFHLWDTGHPALGGQWHHTLENAQERAEYVMRGTYVKRIEYLEQRVQVLEGQIARTS